MTTSLKLLLDEMLSGQIAVQLRSRGFDVIAVVEDPGLVSMPDEDLLAHARAEGRCLVTANIADFATLSAQWRAAGHTHPGLAYITNREFPQDRSFVGALVNAVTRLVDSGRAPGNAAETYLHRVTD